jgi:hypothetical protein
MRREVYWNLHKRIWSVRGSGGGKLCMHTRHVIIYDATFVVQPAGRAKVLREKRKNVHAFVRGDFWASSVAECTSGYQTGSHHRFALSKEGRECVRVTYNPYRSGTFVEVDTGMPVTKAAWVLLTQSAHGGPEVWACFDTTQRKEALRLWAQCLDIAHSVQPMNEAQEARQRWVWMQIVGTDAAIAKLEEMV